MYGTTIFELTVDSERKLLSYCSLQKFYIYNKRRDRILIFKNTNVISMETENNNLRTITKYYIQFKKCS